MSKTVKRVNTDTPWDASGIRLDRWLNMGNGDDEWGAEYTKNGGGAWNDLVATPHSS